MPVEWGDLAFKEAIDFFRDKLSIPTERWTDIMADAHNRSFMVAGAAKADMLTDFRSAIDKALEQGTTLEEFRKDFDNIVAKYGWQYKGGRGWRTKTIYETNLRTQYAAGRYKQMQDPDVKRLRPYWRYRHSDASINPRQKHLDWDGKVLAADDPWWDTHYPPNGWGCKCFVETLSRRDMERLGKDGPDPAPETDYYAWENPATGETEMVPNGLDPGWDYAPGKKDYTPRVDKYPPELREKMKQELDL
ncbi:MAG: phage minor head protein [Desulfobacterales bacterium]|nr:phage minor head protein [Desulfobacterales bacterium]